MANNDLLYFNGVTLSGDYGQQPMTAQKLKQHVWGVKDAAYNTREKFEQLLQRQTLDKILEIVDLLMELQEQSLKGTLSSRDIWLDTLAQRLTALLLLEEAETRSGNAIELREQLEQDASGTLQLIIELLSKKDGAALTELLLNPEPDTRTELKEKLKAEAQLTIIRLQTEQLSADAADAVAQASHIADRDYWREALLLDLRTLPIQSLAALTEHKYLVSEPINRSGLISSLNALRAGDAKWDRFIQSLSTIVDQGQNASWRALVDVLAAALKHLRNSDDPTTWRALCEALSEWLKKLLDEISHLGLVEGANPKDLSQAGWGIIFPARMDKQRREAIKSALEPLLRLRLLQVDFKGHGAIEDYEGKNLDTLLAMREELGFDPQMYFRIYEGRKDGYRPKDTARGFLDRHGAHVEDPANPELVPYYLLLIGSPEEIPYRFQYQLDVQYAVGRIDFDEIEDYANYARNVVAAETGMDQGSKRVLFLGTQFNGDEPTELSTKHLVKPLFKHFSDKVQQAAWLAKHSEWAVEHVPPQETTKSDLLDFIQADTPPALLFAASHGLEFKEGHSQQTTTQGALMCQNWPGPNATNKRILPEHYLSASDIEDKAEINLQGTIAFLFACFSAGTPRYNEFTQREFKERGVTIAKQPFVAALPKAMLSLAERGALAVVGHVDRTWSTSFMKPETQEQENNSLPVFESTLQRLLTGHPIGSAVEYFNVRYAALSTELTVAYDTEWGPQPSDYELAEMWTQNNDARGYIILGDPAVRLRAAKNLP